jgi:hypothetical protein
MSRIRQLVTVVVALAAAFWMWTVLNPSPQKVIRNRLIKLARTATFEPKEGNISRALKIDKLGGFFADKIELNVDVPGLHPDAITSREELKQAAMAAATIARGIQTDFDDIKIELNPDRLAAYVDLTLNGKVTGESDPIIQQLKINLKKIDGDWLITKVQTIKTLR